MREQIVNIADTQRFAQNFYKFSAVCIKKAACLGRPPERAFLLVQQGGERLVDQKAQRHVEQALEKCEGHIEHEQTFEQTVDRGTDGLIHPDDGLERQVIAHDVGGVDHEVVQRNGEHRHEQRADDRAEQRAPAGLVAPVDKAGGEGEHRPHEEVEQLADVGGRGAVQHGEEQVLQKGHHHAVDGAERKRGEQLGKVGDVELDEGGDERGDGKFDEHEHKGDGREHGGDRYLVRAAAARGAGGGDGVDVGFGHEKTLLLFIFLERTSLPRCMTQKERGNCVVTARSTSSLIRTVTVGSGIAPDRAAKLPLADYTAGGEFHPASKTCISSLVKA